jgi:glycosyltransferase involved in cell wall biosynthesis
VNLSYWKTRGLKVPSVLILVSNNQVGGITSAANALSQSLCEEFDIEVGYFGLDRQKGKILENWIRIKTPQIMETSKLFKFIFRLKSLVVYLNHNSCDFVICQDPSSTLISYLSRIVNPHMKIIGMCHVSNDLLTNLDKQIIRLIYPKIYKVVVPSEYLFSELKQISDSLEIVVIPNSFSKEIASCPWPRSQDIKHGSYIFLGRLEDEKNPQMIIEMARTDPENDYIFCGDGSKSHELKERVRTLGLKNVNFVGFQDPSKLLNLSSVVIIPSLTESFGVVAIEAWLHGVPTLVSSSSKGVLEMLKIEDLGLNLDLDEEVLEWTHSADRLSKHRISDNTITTILNSYHSSAQLNKWVEGIIRC